MNAFSPLTCNNGNGKKLEYEVKHTTNHAHSDVHCSTEIQLRRTKFAYFSCSVSAEVSFSLSLKFFSGFSLNTVGQQTGTLNICLHIDIHSKYSISYTHRSRIHGLRFSVCNRFNSIKIWRECYFPFLAICKHDGYSMYQCISIVIANFVLFVDSLNRI